MVWVLAAVLAVVLLTMGTGDGGPAQVDMGGEALVLLVVAAVVALLVGKVWGWNDHVDAVYEREEAKARAAWERDHK